MIKKEDDSDEDFKNNYKELVFSSVFMVNLLKGGKGVIK